MLCPTADDKGEGGNVEVGGLIRGRRGGWRPPGRGNGGGGGSAPVQRALNPFLPLVGPACRSLAGRSVYHAPAGLNLLPVITLPITPHAHSMHSPYKRVWTYPVTLEDHYERAHILKSKRTHERDEIGPRLLCPMNLALTKHHIWRVLVRGTCTISKRLVQFELRKLNYCLCYDDNII